MKSRVGQVWKMPFSSVFLKTDELYTPCLIVGERTELVQCETRHEASVPYKAYKVLDVVVLSLGEQLVWYEHRPLEQENGLTRVT